MARHFPSFLDAYYNYAIDQFCPDIFHRWIGLSILAGALERKVSVKQGMIYHVPNLYVMLVSHPAVGKSTAIERGVDLLEEMKREFNHNFRIIPNQVTEPALLDLMKIIEYYPLSPTISLPHSSGYFYASEASASALQNTCGDFVATMTAFYDCPKWFRKKLKGEKEPVEIESSCMNLLAGSTFDYLKNLVNEQSVMGGFASRLIYIVSKDRIVRQTKWGAEKEEDHATKKKLIEDLAHINQLSGAFTVTRGFAEAFEKWQPDFDRYLIGLNSPKMESIMSRKGTNRIKLAMLLAISEGDKLVLTEDHFERAGELIDEATRDNAYVLSQAIMADKTSQAGMVHSIAHALEKSGGLLKMIELKRLSLTHGGDISKFKEATDQMAAAGVITIDGNNNVFLKNKPQI